MLAAPPEERLLDGLKPAPATATRRFALIVLGCLLAHLIVIALFVRFERPANPAPGEQEIPVEVIVEPPPPKESAPAPNKEQPTNQAALDEKEATDAPRASDKKEKDALGAAQQSAKEKAEPKPAEAARNPDKADPAKNAKESARQPTNDRTEGEPLKAPEGPRPDAQEQTRAEKTAPQPEEPVAAPRPPTSAAAPDDPVVAALGYSPVGGGNAKTTYLSTVYGLVATHMDLKKVAAGRPRNPGEIVFAIDFGGALVGAKILKSTGLRDVDAAALAALRAASPYPLPPTGSGITLSLKF